MAEIQNQLLRWSEGGNYGNVYGMARSCRPYQHWYLGELTLFLGQTHELHVPMMAVSFDVLLFRTTNECPRTTARGKSRVLVLGKLISTSYHCQSGRR